MRHARWRSRALRPGLVAGLIGVAVIGSTLVGVAEAGAATTSSGGGCPPWAAWFLPGCAPGGGAPSVTGVAPSTGAPGTVVHISGSGFAGVTGVEFGSAPALYRVQSSSSIWVYAPPGAGDVDVSVATSRGSSAVTSADRFGYSGSSVGGGNGSGPFGSPLVSSCAGVGPLCSVDPTSAPGTTPNPNLGWSYAAQPTAAQGTTTTVRFGPFTIPAATSGQMGMNSVQTSSNQQPPCTDCYVTEITPSLTYANGSPATLSTGAWFHHTVVGDYGPGKYDATCNIPGMERFYASGDEHDGLHLPQGDGYYIGPTDTWGDEAMLMNMNPTPQTVYVTLQVTWVPHAANLTPVRSLWLDVAPCVSSANLSTTGYQALSASWTSSVSGEIVAATGHVHNGAINLIDQDVTQSNLLLCNAVAHYEPTPTMQMTGGTMAGIGVESIASSTMCLAKPGSPGIAQIHVGDVIRTTAVYDASGDPGAETTGVMGISRVYVVPTGAVPGGTGS